MVPRIYYFDTSKDYFFPDQWRDRPLPYHLYSNAYMDFHIAALRDYAPSAFSSWSEAIQEAYLSDFDPALEEEDDVNNEWLGEGEAEFE